MLESSAHRDRVRVVAVVQHKDSRAKADPFASQAREGYFRRLRRKIGRAETERNADRDGAERVLEVVLLVEGKGELGFAGRRADQGGQTADTALDPFGE